ncbi:multiprotein-bridging factor 1 family protein [Mycobacterium sp. PSTR-4-N]|uniref:helix-turn-helix domain-containing protein n=1 Tax=Mycobacterium sp. PSTR-4-N TaxID=2917745 RepID=UPI0035AE1C1B
MIVQPEQGSFVPVWSFGDRIRKARNEADMTQAEFATAIGVKEGSLAAWETDRATPRDIVAVAKRVELLTRIPAAWLLGLPMPDLPLPRLDSNQQPFG